MTDFDWLDPFRIDEQLSEEERLAGDTAREYAQHKLLPRIWAASYEERFDRAIMHKIGALRLLGATLPEAHGGAGAS